MFVVANRVYYQLAHTIERVATDGTGQVVVAQDPVALAATPTALYWIQTTSFGDGIWKMLAY
jgi:hypothetical protein